MQDHSTRFIVLLRRKLQKLNTAKENARVQVEINYLLFLTKFWNCHNFLTNLTYLRNSRRAGKGGGGLTNADFEDINSTFFLFCQELFHFRIILTLLIN